MLKGRHRVGFHLMGKLGLRSGRDAVTKFDIVIILVVKLNLEEISLHVVPNDLIMTLSMDLQIGGEIITVA